MPRLHRPVPWGTQLTALAALSCSVGDPGSPAKAPSNVVQGTHVVPSVPAAAARAGTDTGDVSLAATCSPRPLWRFHAGSPLAGQPAIGPDGQICVVTTEGLVHLLGPRGGFQWSYTLPFGVAAGPAMSGRGNCYVGTVGRRFYSISGRGAKRWERRRLPRPGSDLVSRPGGGFAYLGARGGLHVFSAYGTDVGHTLTGRGSAGPRWIDRGRALVGTTDGRVFSVKGSRVQFETRLDSESPQSADAPKAGAEPPGGARRGKADAQRGVAPVTAVVVAGEGAYVVAGDTLVALDGQLGERWRRQDVQFASLAPGADSPDSGVVAVSTDGLVTRFSPTGDVLASWQASQPSAAAVVTPDGWAFVPGLDGRISFFPPQAAANDGSRPAPLVPLVTARLANAGFRTPLVDSARARVVFAADSGEIVAFPLRPDELCPPPAPPAPPAPSVPPVPPAPQGSDIP